MMMWKHEKKAGKVERKVVNGRKMRKDAYVANPRVEPELDEAQITRRGMKQKGHSSAGRDSENPCVCDAASAKQVGPRTSESKVCAIENKLLVGIAY